MISILVHSFRFLSLVVKFCHPNFEPIEFKLAHVKRKLIMINYNSHSFLLSDEFLSLCGRFYFIKDIKKTCSSCIVELYKHAGIFKNTREVREKHERVFYFCNCCAASAK